MLRKALNLELQLKSSDSDEWAFEGYGNTFNFKDLHGDITMPGAFTKSIQAHKEKGTLPALLLHHDMHRPVGKFTEIREDGVGLKVSGTLTKGVRDAEEAHLLMKDGVLKTMSIGYFPVSEEWDSNQKANLLHEADVFEISLVTIPSNSQSLITGVKDADGKPLIRQLELALREAGLSRREAKAVLSSGFSAIENDDSPDSSDELEKAFNLLQEFLVKKIQ